MKLSTTLSGSFNRHFNELQTVRDFMTKQGIDVLSPTGSRVVKKQNDFVFLDRDKGTIGAIELKHLDAIAKSDFLYVVNPGGRIGPSSSMEIGYALAHGVPVLSQEKFSDSVFSTLTENIPLHQLKSLSSHKRLRSPKKRFRSVQQLVAEMVESKKFSDEGVSDLVLLLTEEVGELARALRGISGIKNRRRQVGLREKLAEELGDCTIYLLNIANRFQIDLESAIRRKLLRDLRRKWV